jgi:dihydroorotate dehydrogenase (fumarate)
MLDTPDMRPYNGGPEKYLEHLERCRKLVKIPLIASLNGSTDGDWLDFARKLEQAGADAVEFNAYSLASYPIRSAQNIEDGLCRTVHGLVTRVKIPVAVKLHPFYTSLPHLAARLTKEGARGLTLFNRFYYPDLDAEKVRSDPALHLSDQSELLLRLRWTAMLSSWLETDVAITGGVHSPEDVVKSLLVGARAVQCASALLRNGIDRLTVLRDGLQNWMRQHNAVSVKGMIGRAERSERLARETASERSSYLEVIRAFKTSVPAA